MPDFTRAAAHPVSQSAARPPSRAALFFVLFLAAALNSVAGLGVRTVAEAGPATAFSTLFGVSAVIWMALAAGLKILADATEAEPVRRIDWWLAAAACAAVLLPFDTAAMAALTLLAAWAIATGGAGSPLRRAGIVFLAMSGALVWGRVVLAVFSGPLLAADALFVSSLLGSEHLGNTLWYAGEGRRLVVAPGCSSMQGMSLAILFWATVNQLFAVRFGVRAAVSCVAALAATVLINVLRIGAMLRFPGYEDAIHVGWGYQLSMWATLIVVAAICLYGARDDVFRRA